MIRIFPMNFPSGKTWYGSGVLIVTGTNAISGNKSALLDTISGGSTFQMLQDTDFGLGTVSFQYRRYQSETQVPWIIEHGTNAGAIWTEIGRITGISQLQTFSRTLNTDLPSRIRIKPSVSTSFSRRILIDNIILTPYTEFPVIQNVLNTKTVYKFISSTENGFNEADDRQYISGIWWPWPYVKPGCNFENLQLYTEYSNIYSQNLSTLRPPINKPYSGLGSCIGCPKIRSNPEYSNIHSSSLFESNLDYNFADITGDSQYRGAKISIKYRISGSNYGRLVVGFQTFLAGNNPPGSVYWNGVHTEYSGPNDEPDINDPINSYLNRAPKTLYWNDFTLSIGGPWSPVNQIPSTFEPSVPCFIFDSCAVTNIDNEVITYGPTPGMHPIRPAGKNDFNQFVECEAVFIKYFAYFIKEGDDPIDPAQITDASITIAGLGFPRGMVGYCMNKDTLGNWPTSSSNIDSFPVGGAWAGTDPWDIGGVSSEAEKGWGKGLNTSQLTINQLGQGNYMRVYSGPGYGHVIRQLTAAGSPSIIYQANSNCVPSRAVDNAFMIRNFGIVGDKYPNSPTIENPYFGGSEGRVGSTAAGFQNILPDQTFGNFDPWILGQIVSKGMLKKSAAGGWSLTSTPDGEPDQQSRVGDRFGLYNFCEFNPDVCPSWHSCAGCTSKNVNGILVQAPCARQFIEYDVRMPQIYESPTLSFTQLLGNTSTMGPGGMSIHPIWYIGPNQIFPTRTGTSPLPNELKIDPKVFGLGNIEAFYSKPYYAKNYIHPWTTIKNYLNSLENTHNLPPPPFTFNPTICSGTGISCPENYQTVITIDSSGCNQYSCQPLTIYSNFPTTTFKVKRVDGFDYPSTPYLTITLTSGLSPIQPIGRITVSGACHNFTGSIWYGIYGPPKYLRVGSNNLQNGILSRIGNNTCSSVNLEYDRILTGALSKISQFNYVKDISNNERLELKTGNGAVASIILEKYIQFPFSSSSSTQYLTYSIDIDASGINSTIAAENNYIFRNNNRWNSPTSFSLTDTGRLWTDIAMNSNGKDQVAIINNSGLYYTSNFGNNWSLIRNDTGRNWSAVAMNKNSGDRTIDGRYITAVVYSGNIHVSTDSGRSWILKNTGFWRDVGMSNDGKYQTALASKEERDIFNNLTFSYGPIFTSNNFGVSWTSVTPFEDWRAISMNSGGQVQVAVGFEAPIYISYTSGTSWTSNYQSKNFIDVSISDNARYITALENYGRIIISQNSGFSWQPVGFTQEWSRITMNANGQIQVATTKEGFVFVSENYGSTWSYKYEIPSLDTPLPEPQSTAYLYVAKEPIPIQFGGTPDFSDKQPVGNNIWLPWSYVDPNCHSARPPTGIPYSGSGHCIGCPKIITNQEYSEQSRNFSNVYRQFEDTNIDGQNLKNAKISIKYNITGNNFYRIVVGWQAFNMSESSLEYSAHWWAPNALYPLNITDPGVYGTSLYWDELQSEGRSVYGFNLGIGDAEGDGGPFVKVFDSCAVKNINNIVTTYGPPPGIQFVARGSRCTFSDWDLSALGSDCCEAFFIKYFAFKIKEDNLPDDPNQKVSGSVIIAGLGYPRGMLGACQGIGSPAELRNPRGAFEVEDIYGEDGGREDLTWGRGINISNFNLIGTGTSYGYSNVYSGPGYAYQLFPELETCNDTRVDWCCIYSLIAVLNGTESPTCKPSGFRWSCAELANGGGVNKLFNCDESFYNNNYGGVLNDVQSEPSLALQLSLPYPSQDISTYRENIPWDAASANILGQVRIGGFAELEDDVYVQNQIGDQLPNQSLFTPAYGNNNFCEFNDLLCPSLYAGPNFIGQKFIQMHIRMPEMYNPSPTYRTITNAGYYKKLFYEAYDIHPMWYIGNTQVVPLDTGNNGHLHPRLVLSGFMDNLDLYHGTDFINNMNFSGIINCFSPIKPVCPLDFQPKKFVNSSGCYYYECRPITVLNTFPTGRWKVTKVSGIFYDKNDISFRLITGNSISGNIFVSGCHGYSGKFIYSNINKSLSISGITKIYNNIEPCNFSVSLETNLIKKLEFAKNWRYIKDVNDIEILTFDTGTESSINSVRWFPIPPLLPTGRSWKAVDIDSSGINISAAAYNNYIYTTKNDFIIDSTLSIRLPDDKRNWIDLSMNSRGSKQVAVISTGLMYLSIDTGNNWSGLKICDADIDGRYITAVAQGDRIYVSYNSGQTWEAKEEVRSWQDVAMSSNARYQTAVTASDKIYVSHTFGKVWSGKQNNRSWNAIAMTSNGEIQVATANNDKLYYSNNYGSWWDPLFILGSTNRQWRDVAISDNGYISAVAFNDYIYASNDFGLTWNTQLFITGWQAISLSRDGRYQTAVAQNSQIYISHNFGQTWSGKDIARDWRSVGINGDGSVQTAVTYNGQIYTSLDYGLIWAPKDSNRGWVNISLNYDGDGQAAVGDNIPIYLSESMGGTFFPVENNRVWRGVAMNKFTCETNVKKLWTSVAINKHSGIDSEDGKYIYAATDYGFLYRSLNTGKSWSAIVETNEDGDDIYRYWKDVATNHNGQRVTAVHGNKDKKGDFDIFLNKLLPVGRIVVSQNYGNTWLELNSNNDNSSVTDKNWSAIAMNSSGNVQIAAEYNGQIWVSFNSGLKNWAPTTNKKLWTSLSMSADGRYVTAVGEYNRINISQNSGINWFERGLSKDWTKVTMSADGRKQVATAQNGDIYVSNDYGWNWSRKIV